MPAHAARPAGAAERQGAAGPGPGSQALVPPRQALVPPRQRQAGGPSDDAYERLPSSSAGMLGSFSVYREGPAVSAFAAAAASVDGMAQGPESAAPSRSALSICSMYEGRSRPPSRLTRTYTSFKRAITPQSFDAMTGDLPARSLWVLSLHNPLRKGLIYVVTNKLFEWFFLSTILANCATLGMSTNKPGFDDTTLGKNLRIAELVWLGLFTLEMVTKVLALGFVLGGKGSYLRNGEEARARASACVLLMRTHCVHALTSGECRQAGRRVHVSAGLWQAC